MFLYHYHEKGRPPFMNLSDLPNDDAIKLHTKLSGENKSFAARDADGQYMLQRRIVEARAYEMFVRKGGKPARKNPHYMVLGESGADVCEAWFLDSAVIKIPLDEFDKSTLSFTYGDSFPAFKPIFDEEPEYDLYLYDEIVRVINERGMPQFRENMEWYEPRYIEVQVWSDETINNWR